MFCSNGHNQFVIGPEYVGKRSGAVMTCLQCGDRFDAYAMYGVGPGHRAARQAA